METVRKKGKQIGMWLLTLFFCVGIWKGQAQAMEGTVEASKAEIIGYSDNIKVEGDADGTPSISVVGAEFTTNREILVDPDVEEFSITATTNNYQHKVISWELSGSSEASDLKEVGNDNKIKRNRENGWSSYNYGLYVNWGKIIELRDEQGNELGICYEEAYGEDASAVTIELPKNPLECSQGLFFSGWNVDIISGIINGDTYTANFDRVGSMYYKEVLLKRFESNIIPGSGTFLLNGNDEYILGPGNWKVGDDGYSYNGDQVFYLPADGNYTFTGQEE